MNGTYLRGELYYADLGTGIGSEQNGYHPVVIIQNDVGNRHSPTTIIAAISTRIGTKAKLPTHYHLGSEACLAVYGDAGTDSYHRQETAGTVHRKTL